MADFFRSDDHIGHANIIKLCNRPYQNIDQMKRDYIKKHNAKVTKEDTTYFLGDVMMGTRSSTLYDYIHALHGRKILIMGNHDELSWYRYIECGFEQVHSYLEYKTQYLTYHKWNKIHLIHDPAAACIDKNSLWISGHLHSSEVFKFSENHFDCGVDASNGIPYSLDEILSICNI